MIMSVTLIDKSCILSDNNIATIEEKFEKLFDDKHNKVKNNILKLKDDDSNLCQVNYMGTDSIIDAIHKTPSKKCKRKRAGSTSCSEDSSFSSSPEIKFASPIQYSVCKRNSTTLVIKKTMSRRNQSKSKKCNDEDIANLLNSDDEDEIFDSGKKANSNSNSNSSTEKKTKIVRESLVTKIRRSTEQSNYKIESVNAKSCQRRASLRSSITTPMKYRSDNTEIIKRKLPIDDIKSKNYHEDNDDGSRKKNNDKESNNTNKSKLSSDVSILKCIATAPVERKRTMRNTRLVSTDSDNLDEKKYDEMNKENESEDSYHSDESESIETQNNEDISDKKVSRTPRKKGLSKKNVNTPSLKSSRKISRTNETKNIISDGSPEKLEELIEEPMTPKRKVTVNKCQTPSVKIHTLTPSIQSRKSVVEKRKTIFEMARAKLHVSAVPKSLPCREKEFNDVFTFLERKLMDCSGGCMYISGVPGTGKTATVNEAIRCLRKLVERNTIDDFRFIEINGMKLSEPRQAYVQILKQLTGETATWEVARSTIEKKLTNPKGNMSMTLLLIDELDVLCNKRQDVVYSLLDWPSKPSAKLIVITIANTMDLPERVLMSRVTSRLGLTRLTFQPYNHKQLQEIVITRLNESDAFKSEAIQLVARKVAAVSGDARRALDICRRATEIAENDQSKIVSMSHVNEALTEMIANAKVRAIIYCSKMEQVFLQAICAEIKRTGVEETIFNDVYKQFEALCSFEGEKIPNITESLEINARLSANRLILSDDSRKDIHQKIFLNVSSDDIYFALNNVEF